MTKIAVAAIATNLTISSILFQAGGMGLDMFVEIARNAPALVVVVGLVVYTGKFLERLATLAIDERGREREHSMAILIQQGEREITLANSVAEMAKQIAINSSVVAEASNVDDVLGALINRAFPERPHGDTTAGRGA